MDLQTAFIVFYTTLTKQKGSRADEFCVSFRNIATRRVSMHLNSCDSCRDQTSG